MNGAPQLWILVEYQSSGKFPNKTYEVVDVKDVRGPSGNMKMEISTGKLIYVKRTDGLVCATIVIISDDKNFLDTELKELIELEKNEQNMQPKKRRRVTQNAKTETHASDQLNEYHGWPYGRDRDATQSSVIISNPNVQNHPPMTFDQQTQTDFKPNHNEHIPAEARLAKIMANSEMIIQSQQTMDQDNHEMKQQIHDLSAQMFEVKTLLTDVLSKMQILVSDKEDKRSSNDVHSTNSVLNYARNSTPTQAPRILNLSQQGSHQPQQTLYSTTIALEPIEASNDSSFSASNNSRRSLSASNHSIYQNDTNYSITSLNSSSQALDLKHDSAKMSRSFMEEIENGNDNDEIVIGTNQTTVPRSLLKEINWKSHTAATRKLLRAKFSRETLATHSLTGKPSPGKCSSFFIIPFRSIISHRIRTPFQLLWTHPNRRKIN